MPGIASSSPPVLIAHLAAGTSTIRLGSGGVMLPNHSPLVVAEQFGMLEALHPGRIDLGIGRAPGTDPVTAAALRRSADGHRRPTTSPQQLGELLAFFDGTFPEDHPYRQITAVPGRGLPARHLAARVERLQRPAWPGMLGLPFSFAHHFSAAQHARRRCTPTAPPSGRRRCWTSAVRDARRVGDRRGRRRPRGLAGRAVTPVDGPAPHGSTGAG